MTYETFKNEVNKLKLHFHILDEVIRVGYVEYTKYVTVGLSGLYVPEFKELCNVHIQKRFSLHQTYRFYKLEESLQEKLFDLVNELAKTPLDQRGELE